MEYFSSENPKKKIKITAINILVFIYFKYVMYNYLLSCHFISGIF